MLTRVAIFEGTVDPEDMRAFRASVEETLVPMWTRFPGMTALKVMFSIERDDGAPAVPLMLTMTFPNRAALQKTLDAPLRMESRAATQSVCKGIFFGKIHHYITESQDYSADQR